MALLPERFKAVKPEAPTARTTGENGARFGWDAAPSYSDWQAFRRSKLDDPAGLR
jgi:hypothetical protein